MKNKTKRNFTLVEVAVVLLVLVALAGITVPLALGYAQRSHGSAGASNIAQLTANINRFESENFTMPDNWDNLIDNNGTAYDTTFTAATLSTEQADALNDAGITLVHPIQDQELTGPGSQDYQTFNGTGAAVAVNDTLDVATLPGAVVVAALGTNNDPADTYVAFGIGENLTAVGNTIASAPYDFPEGAEKPEESYRRFLAIFNVSEEKAKFVGIVANEAGELSNIQDHINEYYEATE